MRVLSGIQPSGVLHLGNYFGAIRQHLDLHRQHDCYYFIADYHALTSIRDRVLLHQYTCDVALDYLALGLDPEKAVFYRQSDLPEVTELQWILTSVTPMGLLERCHSYKDKIARGIPFDHGLFAYPVLMAADILIVNADVVPVGQDQKQHIEVTRDIAQKFNNLYSEVFVIPKDMIREETAVVPGVDGQKMSKSYGNTIEIFSEGKALKQAVMSIVTDCAPVEAPKDPDTNNVYNLLKLFAAKEETSEWAEKFRKGGLKYSDVKKRLIELINLEFGEARERRKEISARKGFVEDVLASGVNRVRPIARETLSRARVACGLD
ncbi:MAG TPA: tryptophan--tRNA ligase [Thermoanaerobaculia bacterium]|nr:tryptophan--tRNA ligase [Thermoanaerobaculia bacterium]HUM30390.1 tryptophan--tRNA ligase [Thermoanaerobaculia bacterium]HXK68599.1 tryptophan--tRNA ligase [Thermoanaerobaculia bacterium]